MKRSVRQATLALLTLAALLPASAAPSAASEMAPPAGFLQDYDQAARLAAEQHKPLYIHFTTDWCGWCRKIESETYPDADVAKLLGEFVAVSLDCTDEENAKVRQWLGMMHRYGGQGFPTLAMTTSDGELLNMVGGYLPPDKLVVELRKALDLWKQLEAFRTYAKTADRSSLDYLQRALTLYEGLDMRAKAAEAGAGILALVEAGAADKPAAGDSASADAPAQADKPQSQDKPGDRKPPVVSAALEGRARLAVIRGLVAEPLTEASRKRLIAHRAALEGLVRRGVDKALVIDALLEQAAGEVRSLSQLGSRQEVVEAVAALDPLTARAADLARGDAERIVQVQLLMANNGMIHARLGELDEARKRLQGAIELAPDSPLTPRIAEVVETLRQPAPPRD